MISNEKPSRALVNTESQQLCGAFGKLPLELRRTVYRYLLVTEHTIRYRQRHLGNVSTLATN